MHLTSDGGWQWIARSSARSIRRSACRRWRSPTARCCCSRSRSSNISTRSHPQPPLLPADAIERAQVRAVAQIIACDIHPLNNLVALNYLKGPLKHDQAAIDDWYRHWVDRKASTRSKR